MIYSAFPENENLLSLTFFNLRAGTLLDPDDFVLRVVLVRHRVAGGRVDARDQITVAVIRMLRVSGLRVLVQVVRRIAALTSVLFGGDAVAVLVVANPQCRVGRLPVDEL